MRYSTLFSAALFSVAFPFFTSAEHHASSSRRHNALASRKRGDLQALQSRGETGARATFYDVGLGACGKVNKASDFIVALNAAQFGGGYPGPHCFKMITINYKGKSTQAQIMDECPGCPPGGLDMSRGLFTFFEPESVGVFNMDWHYNDGDSGPPPAPAPKPAPKPKPSSSKAQPKPTSSSLAEPSPKSTSKPSSTSSKASSSHSASSTLSLPSVVPSVVPVPIAAPQNLQGLNALVGALGTFVAQYAA